MIRTIVIAVGLLMAAMGLLWIGQGLGYVRWPASSFMIDRSPWVVRGAMLAAAGLVVVLIGRRVRR